jgi:rhomboid family GlyGly-CTERM serine protease
MGFRRPVGGFKGLLTSLNSDGKRGAVLLAILALLLALQLSGPGTLIALRYERGAIAAGEWWRLVTAHLVHLDLRHTLLNGLGLILMWALFVRDYRARQWFLILVTSAATIDAGMWFFDRGVNWYVGASGVLHGMMAAGVLAAVRRHEPTGFVLGAFLIGKLVYEQTTGALPLAGPAVPVVVDAHLYGVIGGAVAALCIRPQPVRL